MFFSQNINELRQFYIDAWHKHQEKQALTPLEQQICHVLENHPEYQSWISESFLTTNFHPEVYGENPFLHMGLHIAIQEQIQTNRPQGIQDIYFSFIKKFNHLSIHDVEHQFMEILAKTLWEAQRSHKAPDETAYLLACKELLRS